MTNLRRRARTMFAALSALVAFGALAGPASASTWHSYLNASGARAINGAAFSATLSDHMVQSSTFAGWATTTMSGSARTTWRGTNSLPNLRLFDTITFQGFSGSISTGGFGVQTSGNTVKFTSPVYARSWNVGHVYSGLTARGAQVRVVHTATGRTQLGAATYDVSASDSCGVYSVCY